MIRTMAKGAKSVNNQWLRDGLADAGYTQAELARDTGLDPTKLNKSVKDTRSVPSDEYRLIMEAFRRKKASQPVTEISPNGQMTQDKITQNGNNAHVSGTGSDQEGKDMGDDGVSGGLKDAVLKDILKRLDRLEGRVLDKDSGSAETSAGFQKRRRV